MGLVGSFRKRTTFDSTNDEDMDEGSDRNVATASVADSSMRAVTGDPVQQARWPRWEENVR